MAGCDMVAVSKMSLGRYAVLAQLLGALLLGACDRADDGARQLDALDAELTGGDASGARRDPALMSALHDQIMVDPNLVGQANLDAVRPPATPYAAPLPADTPVVGASDGRSVSTSETLTAAPKPVANCPECAARREALTLGGLAARQADKSTRGCARAIGYSAHWAEKLPADFPLYHDARVSEAAGNQAGGCSLRIVSFASAVSPQVIVDYYYSRARHAGYTAEHRADSFGHVIIATRKTAAVVVFVSPREDHGSDVDLLLNSVK